MLLGLSTAGSEGLRLDQNWALEEQIITSCTAYGVQGKRLKESEGHVARSKPEVAVLFHSSVEPLSRKEF